MRKQSCDNINVFPEVELENGIVGTGAATASDFVFGETLENALFSLQSENVQE